MWKRSAAIATGYTQDAIDEALFAGNIEVLEQAVARSASHMRFDYNSSPRTAMYLNPSTLTPPSTEATPRLVSVTISKTWT